MAFSFKKAEKPIFKTKVTVRVANDTGGHDTNTFTAHFKRTSTEELKELGERGLTDAELARDRLVGWNLTDADTGEAVEFSPETLEAVLSIQPTPKSIVQAFYGAVLGGKS